MNFPTIAFKPERDLESNARILSKVMQDERARHALSGFRFLYGNDEFATHKRVCPAFEFSCYEMMRNARDDRKAVRLFRNMNGELAAELI